MRGHPSPRQLLPVVLNLLLGAALWADFLRLFLVEWEVNEQYQYGFFVVPLVWYLLWLRWEDRPAPSPRGWGWMAEAVVLLLVLAWPVKLVLVSNPDWRLALWAYAALFLGCQTALLARWGGGRWAAHFLPALALLLFAVPWPWRLESGLTQTLMKVVAGTTVEALNWVGIYAARQGNLIRLSGGLVGVEEACSGVRSLQASVMAAYFVGELYRFTRPGRVLLLAAGALIALGLNLLRTFSLTLATAERGPQFLADIHDPVGRMVSVAAFVLLLGLAYVLKRHLGRRDPGRPPPPTAESGATDQPSAGPAAAGAGWNWIRPAGATLTLALALGVHLTVAGWYRWLTPDHERRFLVEVDWARAAPATHEEPISADVRTQLRFSEGTNRSWMEPDGSQWRVFFFTWEAGAMSSFMGVHRPDTCLPSAGFRQTATHPPLVWRRGGAVVRLDIGTYRLANYDLQVFSGVWDDNPLEDLPLVAGADDRWRAAWAGKMVRGRRSIEIIVAGLPPERARARVEQFLERSLTVREEPGPDTAASAARPPPGAAGG